jgi:hypothetical protein
MRIFKIFLFLLLSFAGYGQALQSGYNPPDVPDLDSIVSIVIENGIITLTDENGTTHSDTILSLGDQLVLFYTADAEGNVTLYSPSDTIDISNGLRSRPGTYDIGLGDSLVENTTIATAEHTFTLNAENKAYLQKNTFGATLFELIDADSMSLRMWSIDEESNRAVITSYYGRAIAYTQSADGHKNGLYAHPDATTMYADDGFWLLSPNNDTTAKFIIDTAMVELVNSSEWLLALTSDSTVVRLPFDLFRQKSDSLTFQGASPYGTRVVRSGSVVEVRLHADSIDSYTAQYTIAQTGLSVVIQDGDFFKKADIRAIHGGVDFQSLDVDGGSNEWNLSDNNLFSVEGTGSGTAIIYVAGQAANGGTVRHFWVDNNIEGTGTLEIRNGTISAPGSLIASQDSTYEGIYAYYNQTTSDWQVINFVKDYNDGGSSVSVELNGSELTIDGTAVFFDTLISSYIDTLTYVDTIYLNGAEDSIFISINNGTTYGLPLPEGGGGGGGGDALYSAAWLNRDSVVIIFDEFINGGSFNTTDQSTEEIGNLDWSEVVTGTNAELTSYGTYDGEHYGALRLFTTNTSSTAGIWLQRNGVRCDADFEMVARVYLQDGYGFSTRGIASDFIVGFVSSLSTAPAAGVYFAGEQFVANYQFNTRSSSTETGTDTGLVQQTEGAGWHDIRITYDHSTTTAKCYYDGTLVGTNTTNLPSSTTVYPVIWKNSGSGGDDFRLVDYVGIRRAISR